MIVIEEKELFQTLARILYAVKLPPQLSGLVISGVFNTLKVKLDPEKVIEWGREEVKQNPNGLPFID